MKMSEGEFEFDFTAAKLVEKLDDPAKQRPQGMQLVDFVLEEERHLVMVEVKDPSCKAKGANPAAEAALKKERAEFVKKFRRTH